MKNRRAIRDGEISNVSDTALWVATFRGQEGERKDAAFHDPLATLLAGTRGRQIAASMPRSAVVAWAMIVRTAAIDRLINESLATGIDCVLNLGAGLDTRPYRMALPSALRWIEVDFPNIVELKNSQLAERPPACRVERVELDLSDRSSRKAVFAQLGSESKNALVISEGVLPYLSNDEVASLAGDLYSTPSFRNWIMDFDNAGKRRMPRVWEKRLRAAPFLFQVADWFDFFKQSGWLPHRLITSAEQSAKIHRPYPFAFPLGLIMRALPAPVRGRILSLSGAVMMRKQEPQARR
ncbi:MAG TPA: class I SAM-dependent methyltransferase [Steroidobacteraceae bacterium]|nr:class I SAM-dependent methyltransferase [Steroidobacteraceae bacterium]